MHNKNASRKATALKVLALTSTALVALVLPLSAQAQDWAGATSADWFDAMNWNPGQVPTAADDVKIDNTGSNAPTITGAGNNGVANSVTVGAINMGSSAQLNIESGGTLTSTDALTVGEQGVGAMNILSGGKVNSNGAYLGRLAGGAGAAIVDGAGSTWTNGSVLHVGRFGNGTLTVSSGGAVSTINATLGHGSGTAGSVNVTGQNSILSIVSDITVGESGAGTLSVANGGTVQNAVAILGLNAGASGTVTIDGAGSKWINGGNVVIGYGGTGSLTIANGGTVSTAGSAVLAGQAGSIGTLNIGGAAGSAPTAAGTLDAGTLEFGPGTGTLNFNHTDTSYIFAAPLLGAGTINQFAGSTSLTGDSSGFSGVVNVQGGRLAVNGLLGNGQVTVSDGGTLGGNGLIGSLTANAGSIVAPGNSIGTLNIAGNAGFATGSRYQVELNGAGQSDLIKVGGAANIANGALLTVVKADATPLVVGQRYTVLTAAGGLTGTFTLSNAQLTNFIGFASGSDANSYYVDLTKSKTFASAGLTPNQIATAGVLDTLPLNGTLSSAVASLPSDAAAQYAFDQLSGDIQASTKTMMIEDSRFLRSAVNDRLRAASGGGGVPNGNVVTYDGGKPRMVDAATNGGAVWGQAYGSWGHWNSDGNAARLNRSIGGFFMGADAPAFDNWRFGAISGYSRSSFSTKNHNSSGTSDNYSAGLYGSTNWGAFVFRSGVAYTISDISTSRSVNFIGFGDSLSGDYRVGTAQAFGELGYRMQAGNVALEPFANLAYVNVHSDGFSEKGGIAALTSGSTRTDTAFTTLGLRVATRFDLNGMAVTATSAIGWRHAFGDTTADSTMSFAGAAPFSIGGVPIAKNAAVVDLGLDMNLSADNTLGISYGGQFGSGVTDQTLRASFNRKF